MCSAPSLIRSLWGTVKCGLVPTLCGNRVSIAGKAKKQLPIRVTGIIEDGIMESVLFGAVRKIFEAAQVDVQWDYRTQILWRNQKTNRMTVCPELLSSVAETGLVLHVKDPALRQNESEWSSTLALNKALNTFVGVRRFNSAAGNEPYGPVNLINIRDNVSGEYSEIEHLVCPGVVQSIKTVSKKTSMDVARLAFEYASMYGHSRITVLHKADVMRLSDGLFLKACREVSACYPDVDYQEEKLDSFCLQVTSNPGRYDVLLTTSLYGSIASAVCGTMSGGLATVPTVSYGPNVSVFSTMSDYGYNYYCHSNDGNRTVKKMACDRGPIINPTGIIRAAAWMLNHTGMVVTGRCISTALENTIRLGMSTQDMGGNLSCSEFINAVIKNMADLKPVRRQ